MNMPTGVATRRDIYQRMLEKIPPYLTKGALLKRCLASFVLSWHRRYLRKHADFHLQATEHAQHTTKPLRGRELVVCAGIGK